MITTLGSVAGFSFLLAWASTGVARRLLTRFQVIDLPNVRSSHSAPTPRGAGIAIVLTFFVAAAFRHAEWDQETLWIVCTSMIAAAMGFIDDIRGLPESIKLAGQIFSALALIAGGGLLLDRFDPRLPIPSMSLWVSVTLTLIWIVGVCNAYNFMDGINGIAAIEAVICGVTLAILAARRGDVENAAISVSLAGASAGFLPWNFPKASVFMGDVASSTLGFLFAAMAVRYAQKGGSFFAAALPLLPFLFDTGITLGRRITNKEPFTKAHRSHFYQRLTSLGWTHTAVSALWGALAVCCGAVALFFEEWSRTVALLAVLALVLTHVTVALAITIRERNRMEVRATVRGRDDRDQPA